MKSKISLTLAFFFATLYVSAQTNPLRVNQTIILPKDSIERKSLISSLNDFLILAQKLNAKAILIK